MGQDVPKALKKTADRSDRYISVQTFGQNLDRICRPFHTPNGAAHQASVEALTAAQNSLGAILMSPQSVNAKTVAYWADKLHVYGERAERILVDMCLSDSRLLALYLMAGHQDRPSVTPSTAIEFLQSRKRRGRPQVSFDLSSVLSPVWKFVHPEVQVELKKLISEGACAKTAPKPPVKRACGAKLTS